MRGGRGGSSGWGRHPEVRTLASTLQRLDGQSYGEYRCLVGQWELDQPGVTLHVDHVQGDAYAAPSKVRVAIAHTLTRFPTDLVSSPLRRVALTDFLLRAAHRFLVSNALDEAAAPDGGWSGAKGGDVRIMAPSQHVMEQSAVVLTPTQLELRVEVGLPAHGRRIASRKAREVLLHTLPALARVVLFEHFDAEEVRRFVLNVEDQDALRCSLASAGLVAFVVNGAMLPRRAGDSDLPLDKDGIAFVSDATLQVTLQVPNRGAVTGMGIQNGVSIIVGGAFHGKSTLLAALQMGVYNHVPGDGREFVCCRPNAIKIKAEDGRSVACVNISPFISNLPFGKDSVSFNTLCASGSTSQAASLVEAIECGADLILMDEDTTASNFMIRDQLMAELVPSCDEPITPFVHHVRDLAGISTVLVMGSSGDYLRKADLVIQMKNYQPINVTARALDMASRHGGIDEPIVPLSRGLSRAICPFDAGHGKMQIRVHEKGFIQVCTLPC